MQRLLSTLLFVVLLAAPAGAYDTAYIAVPQADLAKLLAGPPAPGSEAQKRDLEEVLRLQKTRTPEQSERAIADNRSSAFQVAHEVLGPNFTAKRFPILTAFLRRVAGDARFIVTATKDVWHRPRPFMVSGEVSPIGEQPKSNSYPSGHATRGYLVAIILANMVPEKSAELFARGREYGTNRVLAGVHFPTDVEAGRIGGTVIASALMQNATYKKDYAEARAELRGTLGLPQ